MSAPPCRKRRLATLKAAEAALLRARIAAELRGDRRRREQRAYYHPPCKAYHLTSQPLNTPKDGA